MKKYNSDLHIHVGSAMGKAVKITASRKLTVKSIIEESINSKGMDIVGIVDCASPIVLQEITQLIATEELVELDGGGLSYHGQLTIILGSEVETNEGVHVVCYFPDLTTMIGFSEFLTTKVSNNRLSTQRARLDSIELLDFTLSNGGIFMPAHIFTPHKSYYGKSRLSKCIGERISDIYGVELGLSSDTILADRITELHKFTFLSNSDAHSIDKIAREFNVLELEDKNFLEIKKAIMNVEGRKIIANYGLDPKLGKYYYTSCKICETILEDGLGYCEKCDSTKIIKGVYNRILELADTKENNHPMHRPQYFHHIPLEFIPNLGRKGKERVVTAFGSEINVLHYADEQDLKKCLDSKIVDTIIKGRLGSLNLKKGGGGVYGKILF